MKIPKRNVLLAVPFAVISIEIYLGVLIGYIGALALSGKETGKEGIVRSIKFDLGQYRLHLHHWVISMSVIPLAVHYHMAFLSDQLMIGIMGGLAFQGIACYKDWHHVIFRVK